MYLNVNMSQAYCLITLGFQKSQYYNVLHIKIPTFGPVVVLRRMWLLVSNSYQYPATVEHPTLAEYIYPTVLNI